MRTIVLLGMAAGSLLLAGHARAEAPALDYGTPADPDVRVYTGYPDRVPSEVDYRTVNGTYGAEGRWTRTCPTSAVELFMVTRDIRAGIHQRTCL